MKNNKKGNGSWLFDLMGDFLEFILEIIFP